MDITLYSLHWKFVLAYAEDILILSKGLESYVKHVRWTSALPGDTGVIAMSKKCQIFSNTMSYVGYLIHPESW